MVSALSSPSRNICNANITSHSRDFIGWPCKRYIFNSKSWTRSQRWSHDWLSKSNKSTNCMGKGIFRNNCYFYWLDSWRNDWSCNFDLCLWSWSSGVVRSLLYSLNIQIKFLQKKGCLKAPFLYLKTFLRNCIQLLHTRKHLRCHKEKFRNRFLQAHFQERLHPQLQLNHQF